MVRAIHARCSIVLFLPLLAIGCGTTRMTDTQRAASEMLLISQAIDSSVAQVDCSPLCGKCVFLDTQYLDGTVDKGYLISSLRQHLLAHGVRMLEDKKNAEYIVEARSGAVGTDRNGLLVGIPQMSIPAVVPGQPTQIPEVALIKRTDMKGIAKLAVFAYERTTGQMVWQSGLTESRSTLRDSWIFGAGPFSRGTIRRSTELAGEELPKLPLLNDPTTKFKPLPAEHPLPGASDVRPVKHAEAGDPPLYLPPANR